MKQESGATLPIWEKNINLPSTQHLRENLACDVCVVGAGITGLTAAYLLASEGKKVVVLESKSIGGGETSRTTAHLSNALDDQYYNLIQTFGESGAKLACQSHAAAIDKIEAIAKDANIDCDFARVDGYLVANDHEQEKLVLKELEALQQMGWDEVILRKESPVPSLTTLPSLHYPNQGRIHPMKYIAGLARAIIDKGGIICTDTHVVDFKRGPVTTVVSETGHAVSANHLIVATNTPVNDKVTMHTKLVPYRTYVIAARVPKDAVPDALFWDMEEPYHYVRLQRSEGEDIDYDILIVGGEDHKTGQDDNLMKHFRELERWTRLKFPMATEVDYLWSGQVFEPVDGLAYIGRNPGDNNVYIATGDSGHGTTHGTMAGMIINDLIMGRDNPWAALYDPSRSGLKSAGDYMKHNVNVMAQFKDYVTPGEVDDPMQIMPGTGAIMREGTHKIAVYCDQNGIRHRFSAVCKHMGCVVNWNEVESSWDCPCHGSRYDPLGKVITGPATGDLDPIK
ncbi:FAD-dependent oxidoreductase [Pontibacter brevis]